MNNNMHDFGPKDVDLTIENDIVTNDEVYAIPNEDACSAEFPEGCIKKDGHDE
jgi:hypothetical protein